MPDVLHTFFSYSQFIPHGHCYLWKPDLVWLHVVSDALIALAYFSIPVLLIYLIRKRNDLPFHSIFWLFGAFIVFCGTTHVMEIVTLWYPVYWVSGVIKVFTAGVSIFTALELAPLIPKILSLPSPAQLEAANQELKQQIQERERAEAALQKLNQELEARVQARTAELEQSNQALRKEVAERKRAEAVAQESQTRLEMAMNAAHMGMWDFDLASGKISASNQCRLIFDAGLDEFASYDRLLNRIVSEDRDRVDQAVRHSIAAGEDYNIEYRIRWHDGSVHWVAAIGRAFFEDGKAIRLTGVALDITERKLAEEALKRQAQVLEEANRLKDDFLAIVSHELRTPLNSILGWASLLRTRKFDEAKVALALETIERNAKAQTQLIEDLLDISRLMRGKLRLNLRPLDLASVLETSINVMRPTAEAKQIQLINQATALPVTVEGDMERLQQVLWNLLSNAIKFTPNQGQIEIELSIVDSNGRLDQGYGLSSKLSEFAQITIRDTGKGIRADFLPYVFERFRQADSSITREQGGLGLGLAIVRQLVELHGGSVGVTSPGEGKGTTFIIRLPLLISSDIPLLSLPVSPPKAFHEFSSHNLKGLRVLVVDDDPDARFLVCTVLTQAEAIVATAASAEEALSQIEQFNPDLLISDIGMPNCDGYGLIQHIRAAKNGNGRRLPAIALTAYASPKDRIAAISAGFEEHITKPVDPEALSTLVAQLCHRSPVS